MPEFPDTSESLLVRVRDPSDRAAWDRFEEPYRPVVFRIARARGLQHSDALDLVQQVLLSVSSAIRTFEKHEDGARDWRSSGNSTKNEVPSPSKPPIDGTLIELSSSLEGKSVQSGDALCTIVADTDSSSGTTDPNSDISDASSPIPSATLPQRRMPARARPLLPLGQTTSEAPLYDTRLAANQHLDLADPPQRISTLRAAATGLGGPESIPTSDRIDAARAG